MACQPLSLPHTKLTLAYAKSPDEPIAVRLLTPDERLLRAAAWRGILVPTCAPGNKKCAMREMVVEAGWIRCHACGAKAEPLAGVRSLADTIDEALRFALRVAGGEP